MLRQLSCQRLHRESYRRLTRWHCGVGRWPCYLWTHFCVWSLCSSGYGRVYVPQHWSRAESRRLCANEHPWTLQYWTSVSDFETFHSSSWRALEPADLLDYESFARVSPVVGQGLRHKGSGLRWHSCFPSYQDWLGDHGSLRKESWSEEPWHPCGRNCWRGW